MKGTCTGCERMTNIVLRFEATVNGQHVKEQLCRTCLKKRAAANKEAKKN